MNLPIRGLFALILGSFFVSGVAGLVYQVVWTRYLALFLGHTSYAVIAVLAAFMGGLALGNAWLGAVVDRLPRPLLFYAGLELGIGVFAVVFPTYYEWVHQGFLAVVRAVEPSGFLRLTLQFLFASITIFVPTVLMGATLPALTRFVTRSLAELRGRVAALYAINSSGAVLGVILADWWWVPRLGLEVTVYLGAAMSLLVGLLALGASRVVQEGARPPEPPVESGTVEQFTPAQLRLAVIGIGVSGFVAMLYEVAWTRLLGLALGSSTHAYSLMLATFISGIAAGGWLVYRWKRQAHTLTAFGIAELALAGTLFVSLWFYDLLPWWFARLAGLLQRTPESFVVYELLQALVCFGVMFIPAMCLGTTLPLASRIATAELERTGRSVGRVFAINTLGTVLGAVLTGLVFLPALGLAHTFVLGITLNALVGLSLLGGAGRRDRRVWVTAVAVCGVALWGASLLEPRWQKAFSIGLWRSRNLAPTISEYRKQVRNVDLRFHRDGAGSTVVVMAGSVGDGRETLMLRVNGKTDATSVGDLCTQVLASHLPMLMKSETPDVLIVGLGSGVTVGSALRYPEVRRVDVVEISPEVAEAARRFFGPFNGNAFDDERMRLSLEDAKTFLQTTTNRYDVIINEPSNPWMAGVAAVFSHEYYTEIRNRLKPGGLAAQWLQVYETDDHTADLAINTFNSVFPYAAAWLAGARDVLLIGSTEPFQPDLAIMEKRFADPVVQGDIGRVGITEFASLLNLELIPFGDALYVPELDSPVHSDFRPVLEYAAQRAFFLRQETEKLFRISEGRSPRPRWLLSRWGDGQLGTNELRAAAAMFRESSVPEPEVFRSQMRRWVSLDPTAREPVALQVALEQSLETPDAAAALLTRLPGIQTAREREDVGLLRAQADALMTVHRTRRSAFYQAPSEELEEVLQTLIELDPPARRVHRARLAEVLWDRGDDVQFMATALKAFSMDSPDNGPYDFSFDYRAPRLAIARMLMTLEQRNDPTMAIQLIREAVQKGFAGENASYREPVLEFHVRRVLAKFLPPGEVETGSR